MYRHRTEADARAERKYSLVIISCEEQADMLLFKNSIYVLSAPQRGISFHMLFCAVILQNSMKVRENYITNIQN